MTTNVHQYVKSADDAIESAVMAHPIMFDDVDPMLLRVRHLALGFPGGAEKVSHGRPAFFTKKVFAYYGCSVRVDGDLVLLRDVHHVERDDRRDVAVDDLRDEVKISLEIARVDDADNQVGGWCVFAPAEEHVRG